MSSFDGSHQPSERFLIERKEDRRPLKAEAVIRNITQGRIGGQMIDISESGCKIDLFNSSVSPGQGVTIKLENMESWAGHVRWVDGSIVGVQFERRLHPAVVDHLSRSRMTVELA